MSHLHYYDSEEKKKKMSTGSSVSFRDISSVPVSATIPVNIPSLAQRAIGHAEDLSDDLEVGDVYDTQWKTLGSELNQGSMMDRPWSNLEQGGRVSWAFCKQFEHSLNADEEFTSLKAVPSD